MPTDGEIIREALIELAQTKPRFTADDLVLPAGVKQNAIGSTVGRLVSDGFLIDTGDKINSTIPQKKGRLQRVFRAGPQLTAPAISSGSGLFALVKDFHESLLRVGFRYDISLLCKLMLALQARRFVVVSGISGIGKSSIVRLLAAAIHAKFYFEAVMPHWTDATEIIGYYDPSLKVFTPGTFLEALKKIQNEQEFVVYLLDEMNLAHVEYYLGPYLAVSQTPGQRIVPYVPAVAEKTEIEEANSVLIDDRFILFGTVNVDETTKSLSPKVLDRCFLIDINDYEVGLDAPDPDPKKIDEVFKDALALVRKDTGRIPLGPAWAAPLTAFLDQLYTILRPINKHFGARVELDAKAVVAAWLTFGLDKGLAADQMLDFIVSSRILPRLQGTAADLEALRNLSDYLASVTEFNDLLPAEQTPCVLKESRSRVLRMISQAELMQIYSYWA